MRIRWRGLELPNKVVSDKATSDEMRRWLESINDEDLGPYKM